MTRVALSLAALLAVILIAGCGPQGASTTNTEPTGSPAVILRVSGSGSVTEIMQAVSADFTSAVPGLQLEVLTGSGTGGGVRGIVEGTLDVAAMARPPKDDEADQGVRYYELGTGGVALIVHPDVTVSDLTSAQVLAIYSGDIVNWSELDGPDIPVVVYTRDEGDSNTAAMREHILGDLEIPETLAQVITSQSDMLTAISGAPGSIGFATWPTTVASGINVKALSLDGVGPDNADYPMQVTLGIGYLESRASDVQPLLDWLQSDAGQARLQTLAIILGE